jgi:hypothetical protein
VVLQGCWSDKLLNKLDRGKAVGKVAMGKVAVGKAVSSSKLANNNLDNNRSAE